MTEPFQRPQARQRPQDITDDFQLDFSQYILQSQQHAQLFQSSLIAFNGQRQQIAKMAQIRNSSLETYLQALLKLNAQFNAYIRTLRQQRLIEFTLPMEISLAWVRWQWFWQYQGPQIKLGWQQAAQGFQGNYQDPDQH